MSLTLVFSMVSLSLAMSISPGPVNILIITSSINNGFKKTFAFISGATIGFTLLLFLTGFGFVSFLVEYPLFLKILSITGAVFIGYMGYKIATAKADINLDQKTDTPRFYEGFLLQWLNPKAWIASVSGASIYSSSQEIFGSFIFIYFIICYVSLMFWGVMGSKAAYVLNTSLKMRSFNLIMGSLLIFTASYFLFTIFI